MATPAGIAWSEDPGPSKAREAAEDMPAESVHLERIHNAATLFITSYLHNKQILLVKEGPYDCCIFRFCFCVRVGVRLVL